MSKTEYTAVLIKLLSLVVMFETATLATVASILAHDIIMAGGRPITPRLFGPEVYATPAMVWVYMQQFAALMAFCGAAGVASDSRWWQISAAMMVVGNLGLAVLMAILAFYARMAPDGVVMFAMCLGAGLPWAMGGAGVGAWVFWAKGRLA